MNNRLNADQLLSYLLTMKERNLDLKKIDICYKFNKYSELNFVAGFDEIVYDQDTMSLVTGLLLYTDSDNI